MFIKTSINASMRDCEPSLVHSKPLVNCNGLKSSIEAVLCMI